MIKTTIHISFLLITILTMSFPLCADEGLYAGSATVDITPEPGKEMPGGFKKSISKGTHDPLELNTIVLKNESGSIAIVAIDALFIPSDIVENVRTKVSKITPIPAKNIIISASHTHHGGPIIDVFLSERDPEYCSLVETKIIESIQTAWNNLTKVKIAFAEGEQEGIAFNRRFYMKDGTVVTHPGRKNPQIIAPAGPIDPQVLAMFITKEDGTLLGAVVNYALHGTVFSGAFYSADYIHYLRDFLRKQWGETVSIAFLNGACGDVTQINNLREEEPPESGPEWSKRIGETLACQVYQLYLWTKPQDTATIATATETIHIPIRDIDEKKYHVKIGLGSDQSEVYDREIKLLRKMKNQMGGNVDVEITAIRIGDLAIVCNPTELFCRLGLDIKKSSPSKYTMIAEVSNGYTGYCPTPEAFDEGGYEILTARSSFMEPNAGIKIVQTSRKLLSQLFN
ncbi:MAG: hypothetical protein LDL53_06040 [Candidatus Hydrogenedens sp.]|nr:hypothetical protein [Candidatus Hydrogenedens sp.]